MLVQAIIADPPWRFGDKLKMRDRVRRSADSQYQTMSIAEIAALDVSGIADPAGCVLALWVPGSFLEAGLEVMKAWGFKLKQTYVWVKTKRPRRPKKKEAQGQVPTPDMHDRLAFGMGHYFRQCHELVLVGVRGRAKKMVRNRSQRSVSFAPNLGHSIKPELLHESLERMLPGAWRLEMFARRNRDGWLCVGNELTGGQDIAETLADIKGL